MAFGDVETFDPNELYSEYLPLGRNFGHPLANLAARMAFGQNYMPMPQSGQSMYDAFLQRDRSTHFMNLQRSGFMQNAVSKRIGLGDNPVLGLLSGMASPDSALARTMSPFVGGNPMAAQMQLYSGFAGAGIMGNFGRVGAITEGETEGAMQSLASQFYKTQKYNEPSGDLPSLKEKFNQQGRQTIRDIASSKDGAATLKKMGIEGMNIVGGKLDEVSEKKLASFNITDDNDPRVQKMDKAELANKANADHLGASLDELLNKENGKIDKKLREELLADIKKTLSIKKDSIDKFTNKSGQLDTDKLRNEVDQMRRGSPLSSIRAQDKDARKEGQALVGFDFVKSRGFKLEDFTSAFYKAADLRMLGNNKNQGIGATLKDFAANAGGAMSAARSIFGNKASGSELMTGISNMVGSDVDLATTEGAGKAEDLLRKVKATQRVAGISMKTMLAIIDSAKQLASSHPALQTTNSGAITELATKAVGASVVMGSIMTAEEYRKAGGSQGIASKEITTANAYAASPVGATIAAAYYGATEEQKNQLDALLKDQPVTGRSLDQGLRGDMAKIRGMTANQLMTAATDNPELMREAMKDERTANQVYGKANESYAGAMLENLGRKGLSEDKLVQMYKDSGGDFSKVEAQIRLGNYLTTDYDKSVFNHASPGLHKRIAMAAASPEQREAMKAFDAAVAQSQKDDKELDKKYGGKYAPIITQAIDAFASGDSFKGTTEALTRIFATDNVTSQKAKSALEAAKNAGASALEITTNKGLKEKDMIDRGLAGRINQMTQQRKIAAREEGDTQTADALGDISSEDLEVASRMSSQLKYKDKEAARDAYNQLLKSKEDAGADWNTDKHKGERELLTTLSVGMKVTGGFKSDKALQTYQKGGAAAITSSAIQAHADANFEKNYNAEKSDLYDRAAKALDLASGTSDKNAEDVAKLKEKYTENGKLNISKMLEDRNKGEGLFSKDSGNNFDAGTIGTVLTNTQERISQAAQRAGVMGEESPELKSRQDLTKAMNMLVEALSGNGSGIGGVITRLVETIGNKF